MKEKLLLSGGTRKVKDPFDRNPEAVYGIAEQVAPGVRRVTCRNPSAMTFTGTRSYLVGQGEVALIDPGPSSREHLGATALAPGRWPRRPARRFMHSARMGRVSARQCGGSRPTVSRWAAERAVMAVSGPTTR
jgi:hypothetical protein